MVQRKKGRLKVHSITDNGSTFSSQEELKASLLTYYENLLTGSSPPSDLSQTQNLIPSLITPDINLALLLPPSMDEVKVAVFSLNKDAAAGPDGCSALFFQYCWDIIKNDLLEAIQSFFSGESLPLSFSSKNIALIPKKEAPQS